MRKILSLFAAILFAGTLMAHQENYTFSSFTGAATVQLTTANGFVITLAKDSGSTNPAWNTGSSEARVYAKGSLKIAIPDGSDFKITSIQYNYKPNASSGVKPTIEGVVGTGDTGTWTAADSTWTAFGTGATSVLLWTSGAKGNLGFKSLVITFTGTLCTNTLVINKVEPENGDFTLSLQGSIASCSGDISVVVTPTPADHYLVNQVAATNSSSITGPDANGKYTIVYAQNTNATSNVSVTFVEKSKHEVTWNNQGETSTTEVYDGELPEFPTTPVSKDATSTTFIGWATANWTGKIASLAGKTVYRAASEVPAVTAPITLYAVFANVTPAASTFNKTAGEYYIYAIVDGVEYYAKTFAKKFASTTDISEAIKYTFEKNGDNFAIKSGDKYLSYGTSGTDFTVSGTEPYYWAPEAGTHGSWRLKSVTTEARGIIFRAGDYHQFGPYAISGINGTEYFDVEIDTGKTFADFMTTSSATAIDNTEVAEKAQKVIENGQLFIIKNGVKYNAQGAVVR